MNTRLFAALDVGSYEIVMKIVEFTNGTMKVVDCVRYRLDLGSYTYSTGKLPMDKVNELCSLLKKFADIMKSYHITEYKAYGTSAIRETRNTHILLDQIEQRTGIRIDVLSNSEQRFLNYKAAASVGREFTDTITKGTAIIDIGGGSIQISLFDNDRLNVTQNIKLGVMRLRESLNEFNVKSGQRKTILDEMIGTQLRIFDKLYLKNRKIRNLLIVDDYVSPIIDNRTRDSEKRGFVTAERFDAFFNRLAEMNPVDFSRKYSIPEENIPLVFVSAAIIRNAVTMTGAGNIWCPKSELTDGIAYEYAEQNMLISNEHNFEEDIVACAFNIAGRYMSDEDRSHTLERIATTIYDSMKSIHGMNDRDRLCLRLSTILHDCGKYISLYNLATCSYDIIMSTEIIGLSHKEREIVANVVKYTYLLGGSVTDIPRELGMDEDAYMRIVKLTAILRIANGLDKSRKKKFEGIKSELKNDRLVITVRTNEDISFERGIFVRRADFFEEVYNIRPEINHIARL
ncbi:MAG: exopolyphosphatase [Lachnospiraceae bacterium]|nr:exopolyphosphatase [Lachnospiraceae bacterium]